MDDTSQGDICRVCRSEGASDKPLFHPCICTGSIKFIHQDCLVQWLRYSEKDFCELCNHKFSFIPIYSPDMPKRLPFRDILHGLFGSLATAVRFWFHYTLVAVAWLGIVPLTAYRIYRCLFSGSFTSIITLPLDILSTENLVSDGFYGCCVVTCTLCAFICLVWLREQILRGGGPEWLDQQQEENVAPVVVEPEPEEGAPGINENNNINNNNNGELDPDGDVIMEEEAPAVAEDVAQVNEPLENLEPNENNALVAQDDINWNPVEWDRGADELTWERILGLDGSLVFLEHVFWVISLNTLFIIIFAYVPFHIGCFLLVKSDLYSMVEATQFEGLVTTLCGYLVIGTGLVLLHACTSLMSFKRTERLLGLCYVVVKVSLLSVFEIGVFPLICGWWLDICSLPLLGATLEEREASFATAPGTSMFIHWLAGMVYVFYFASFILLLREVLRPGVLWFLQNLNDPEFNPIQEMIHLPIFGHLRRFLASLVIFGTTVLLMMWFPVRIVQKLMPGFLPYNVSLSNGNGSESPTSELSLEFLLLQLVLPALLDHGHLRQWLKSLIKGWCIVMSSVLNIRSYLLGDVPIPNEEEDVVQPVNQATNQPYKCPTVLTFRIISLLVLTGLSLLASGLILNYGACFHRKKFDRSVDGKCEGPRTEHSCLWIIRWSPCH
ncbi:E3 ubiquitin-protein ligase MARCHF6 [Halotydeus destructor]|nr:E3 ubiquitin-protein ligase MARCHF6 [Halotydeus destructor]